MPELRYQKGETGMRAFSEFNAFVRFLQDEESIKKAKIRCREDLYAAYALFGTLILGGLFVIGAVLVGGR